MNIFLKAAKGLLIGFFLGIGAAILMASKNPDVGFGLPIMLFYYAIAGMIGGTLMGTVIGLTMWTHSTPSNGTNVGRGMIIGVVVFVALVAGILFYAFFRPI